MSNSLVSSGESETNPSIIIRSVRSLDNMVDELMALVRHNREFHDCSLMCFTETWLHKCDQAQNSVQDWEAWGGGVGVSLFLLE